MAFGGLKKWFEEASAQVNPFDGGKSASTVRAARNAQPQQYSQGQTNDFNKLRDQYKAGAINRDQFAAGIPSISNRGFNTTPTLAPQGGIEKAGFKIFDGLSNRKVAPVALGIGRSGIGTLEGLSGLYDLATPGKGNNRFTQGLQSQARQTDQTVKDNNYSNIGYKGAQFGTDLATFAIAGMPATKATTKANAAIGKVMPFKGAIANSANNFAKTGKVANATVKSAKYLSRPDILSDLAVDTALNTGLRSARGEQITPAGVGTDAVVGALSAGAINYGGKAIKAATPGVKKGAKKTADTTQAVVKNLDKNTMHSKAVASVRDAETKLTRSWGKLQEARSSGRNAAGWEAEVAKDRRALQAAKLKEKAARINKDSGLGLSMRPVDQPTSPQGSRIAKISSGEASSKNILPPIAPSPAVAPPQQPPVLRVATAANPDANLPALRVQGQLQADPMGIAPPPKQTIGVNDPANKQKTTQFAGKTVPGSEFVSDKVKGDLKAPTYDVQTEKQGYSNALGRLKAEGNEAFEASVSDALDKKTGTIGRQEAIDATTLAQILDAKGDELSVRKATHIYEQLSEHYTAAGQTIQAASIISRMSPAGLRLSATKQLKSAGVEVTPQVQTKINTLIDDVAKTQPQTEARNIAIKKVQKAVADAIPSSMADKLTSTWKAGLLTGIKTQSGNALSNTTFAALRTASDPLAAALDAGMSLVTGKRTKTATLRGRASGTAEGIKKGGEFFKTGIDELGDINKFEQTGVNFKNPILDKYVNGVFRAMGAADKPGRYSQLRNSLNDIAIAEAKNKGLKGDARKNFINEFMQDPPQDKLQVAMDEATEAVLGNDTVLSTLASSVTNGMENSKFLESRPLAKAIASVAKNVIMPFTKVPSAFISRVFDFTPTGAIKEAAGQISRKQFDQRQLATALSEATTGTAIIWLGSQLANNDMLSGEYPTGDQKEVARWKAEGIQPNSIKLGDKWYSMNYLGPVGALFNMGKRINEVEDEGGSTLSQVAASGAGAVQDATGQSFLQGVSGAFDAVNDPKRFGESYVRNTASSTVPTLVKDFAESLDPMQRDASTVSEAFMSRTPGLRNLLAPKQDVFGNDLERKAGALDTLANPFRPSKSIESPLFNELDRLKMNDQDVFPTPIDKSMTFNGERVKLSPELRAGLQKSIGQGVQEAWSSVIQTPEYKSLSPENQKKALANIKDDITAVEKRKFEAKNQVGQYNPSYDGKQKSPTAREVAVTNGTIKLNDYLKNDNGEKVITAEAITKANTDINNQFKSMGLPGIKADESLTRSYEKFLEKVNDPETNSIDKEKVTSSFVKNAYKSQLDSVTQSFYSLGDDAMRQKLQDGVISKEQMDKVIEIDNILTANGFQKYPQVGVTLRRELGYGTVASKSNKRSGGRRSGGKGKKGKALPNISIKEAPKVGYNISGIKAPSVGASSLPVPARIKRNRKVKLKLS